MRARFEGGRVLLTMRTAANNIRDHFLLNGTLRGGADPEPFLATRVPTSPPWYEKGVPLMSNLSTSGALSSQVYRKLPHEWPRVER